MAQSTTHFSNVIEPLTLSEGMFTSGINSSKKIENGLKEDCGRPSTDDKRHTKQIKDSVGIHFTLQADVLIFKQTNQQHFKSYFGLEMHQISVGTENTEFLCRFFQTIS